ncbi:MAG: SGNH/GDSL hydrolase family protein [Sphingobium sp.]
MRKLIGFAGLLTLAGCAHSSVVPGEVPSPKARYIAMGSSYAAGPKLGAPKPETPVRCGRDFRNYATITAQQLNLELIDVTCGGATTVHLLGPWNELPAQLDAVTPDARLVTVTIGGNDVDFVRDVYFASCDPAKIEGACPPVAKPSERAWTALERNLREIAARIRSQAPKARLIFVDYVTIVPERPCAAMPLSAENIALMRGVSARLADVTATVARESHADLIPAGALSRSHTPCDAEPWSMGVPGTGDGAPLHPNEAGMRAIADALTVKLRRWHPQ